MANRDLKLENLLLDRNDVGSRPLLKICDFGYSKVGHPIAALWAFIASCGICIFWAPPPVGFVPPACTWQLWLFHTGVVAVRCRSFSDCCHFVAHLDVIQACRRLRSHCSVVLQHDFNSPAKTGVGTPVYMAPEIILGGKHYDAKVKHDSLAAACRLL